LILKCCQPSTSSGQEEKLEIVIGAAPRLRRRNEFGLFQEYCTFQAAFLSFSSLPFLRQGSKVLRSSKSERRFPLRAHLNLCYNNFMKQLDPKAVWLFFFGFILRSIIPIIIFSIWGSVFLSDFNQNLAGNNEFSFAFLNWLWVIIPIFLASCFVWAKLTFHFYRYELLDSRFRKESGVIYKKYVTIPYDRIQNVDINRGILARILGLSDFNIQTAGASAIVSRYGVMGGGAEGRLPAVSMAVGEQLRDELIQRTRQSKNQGL